MTAAEQLHCMAAEISDRVREIAEARDLPESEVFERALEGGFEDRWEDLVRAQCIRGDAETRRDLLPVDRLFEYRDS